MILQVGMYSQHAWSIPSRARAGIARDAVQGGFQESRKPKKNSVFVHTVPCKNNKSHEDMIPQLLHPGGNPLKEGISYAPDC